MSKTATTSPNTAVEAAPSSFAVVKTGGKQYRVSTGDIITIEKMIGEYKEGDKITFDEVLLKDDGSKVTVGAPTVAGAKVSAEITEIGRGAKVIIMRYKQKSRSGNPKNGHRQPHFKVKILSI